MVKEKCFIASISSSGYVNLRSPNDFDDIQLFATNYMPQENILYLVENYSKEFFKKGFDIQIVYNPMSLQVSGMIVPKLNLGFVSFMPYESAFFRDVAAANNKNVVAARQHLKSAYSHLSSALEIHDKWEKIYIRSMNFNELNRLSSSLSANLFGKLPKNSKPGNRNDYFFGATTPNGAFDFLDDTIKNYKNRYFLKGRPGTGKSSFLNAVAAKAQECGKNVDFYHCAFDPKSIDMIAIRDMNLCIFDSTAPHEYFPGKSDDHVIDIYNIILGSNFDTKHQKELNDFKTKYSAKIFDATNEIKKAYEFYKIFRVQYSTFYKNIKFRKIEAAFLKSLSSL